MDPRAVLHPVGPYEPRVYWTRRAIALGVVLLVVVVLAYSCGGGGGSAAPSARQTPSASPRPSASSTTPTATAVGACRAGQLSVTAHTDADSYPAGVQPHLSVSIANTSAIPCRLAVTGGAITWSIVSGPDEVWSTAGCPHAKTVTRTTLRHATPYRTTLVWDRHRSTQGCATPGAAADPGTYQLRVTTLGVRSAATVFHLTG